MKKSMTTYLITLITCQLSIAQTNTFPSTGSVGIGTLSPITNLHVVGSAQMGSSTNYLTINSSGHLSFTGNAEYRPLANKYAFRIGTTNYGLVFNSNSNQYEFRGPTGVVPAFTLTGTGNVLLKGYLKFSDGSILTKALPYASGNGISINDTTIGISNNGITSNEIAANAVGNSELSDNAVGSMEIINESINGSDIGNDAISSSEIAASAVGSSEVADESITSSDIGSNAVNTSEIANAAITTSKIANNAITTNQIASNSIGNSKMADNSVGSPEIINESITSVDIATDAVGATELANNSVDSGEVIDESLTGADIANNTITGSELASDAVGSDEITVDAVTSSEIAMDAVTSSELAIDAVGNEEIAIDAVTSLELATDAVGSEEISTSAVGSDEITDGSIQGIDLSGMSAVTGQVLMYDGSIWVPGSISGNGGSAFNSVGSPEIINESITSVDIANDAVGSDEIIVDAVTSSELATDAVGSEEIGTAAVSTDEIADGGIQGTDLSGMGAVAGQVLLFDGSFWAPGSISGSGGANQSLSNLSSTSINTSLLPGNSSTFDLGSSGSRWQDLHMNGSLYMNGDRFLYTDNTSLYIGDRFNDHGSDNIAIGYHSLNNNHGDENTAVGINSLKDNNVGNANSSFGISSLEDNETGSYNSAFGNYSLRNNDHGYGNAAFGYQSLEISDGWFNSAFGYESLKENGGEENTGLGAKSSLSIPYLNNATAVGFEATVTSDNAIQLGNAFVNTVNSSGLFYSYSDSRFKSNIKEDVPGLDFINKLKPVTYNFDSDKLQNFVLKNKTSERNNPSTHRDRKVIRHTGFLAQEVERVAREIGYEFDGVHASSNETDPYSLSYAQFVVPLVKAVQELDEKVKILENIQQENQILKDQLNQLLNILSVNNAESKSVDNYFNGISEYILGQNIPNPAEHSTVIPYSIPEKCNSATLTVINLASGKLIFARPLISTENHVNINLGSIASGTYLYTLYVNGNAIDSKQMIIYK